MRWLTVCCLAAVVAATSAVLPFAGSSRLPADDAHTIRAERLIARDSSGHGHHGTNQGGPVMEAPGHRGTAYSFEPPQSWVQVPSSSGLNPGRRDFVLSAWVNIEKGPEVDQTYDIIRKGLAYTTDGEFKLEIYAGGAVRCSVKDSLGREASITGPDVDVTDGGWHHVACARTGSMWSVMVDEVVLSKRARLGSIGNTMPLALGSKYGLEDATRGRVDEVSLVIGAATARRVSPAERISQLLNGDPVGLWHFDEQPSP
jgi:Concanavalin A-like lectin/glucanases superfamily